MAQIPVNTRAVGDPKGDYLLYLEDYVHTFIRKVYLRTLHRGRNVRFLCGGMNLKNREGCIW